MQTVPKDHCGTVGHFHRKYLEVSKVWLHNPHDALWRKKGVTVRLPLNIMCTTLIIAGVNLGDGFFAQIKIGLTAALFVLLYRYGDNWLHDFIEWRRKRHGEEDTGGA